MLWVLTAAIAHSNGSPECGPIGTLVGWGYSEEDHSLAMSCTNGLCTVTANTNIKGILVYRETGDWGPQTDDDLQQDGQCLKHNKILNKNSVTFVTDSTTTIRLTVVYGKDGSGSGGHKAQALAQHVTVLNKGVHVHVVGAGPGGTSRHRTCWARFWPR